MRLYLLRHGPAESRAVWTDPDSERPLTPNGIKVTKKVARHIAELELGLDAIITSPYVRALQTARIVFDALDGSVPLLEEPALEPGRLSIETLPEILQATPNAGNLMLVGHEPSISEVTADLVGGGRIKLKKAGLIRVDVEEPSQLTGELMWLAPPRIL
jgi:phosphohistidine phosphatase